ncbi:MAG: M20/M25/M40 family metallo-hydrolase [Clostridia bacterium]|nr:M20/M25/M40 family metallo-hydrolase [Clostridia bacterium]
MKASESVKNYQSERRMYTNYAARAIKKVCKEIGPRFAGSEEEKKGIEFMAEELKTCCDEVKTDSFTVHPKAFLGWIPMTVVLMTISSVLFFLGQFFAIVPLFYVSVALAAVCFFFIITEFLFYKETLDPFLPKKTSYNAYGIRKASGETKRRIIFAGHADSSMEWRFTYYGGPKLLIPVIGGALFGVLFCTVCSIIAIVMSFVNPEFVNSFAMDVLSYIALGFIVLFLAALFFYDKKRIVEGANDDLTGCFSSIGILKFLQDNDIRFENTEVVALCTGSEEIGLRGAKDFCEKHGKEFGDVETVFVAIDTVHDFDHLAIYNKDMTGTVKNNGEACKLLKEGAKIAGYDVPFKTVSLGATDAAAVSKSGTGMKAAAFAAMDPAPARYYHTRLDNHENLDLKTIEAGLDICLETLFLYDEKGLNV